MHSERAIKRRFRIIRRLEQILHIPFFFIVHRQINFGALHIYAAHSSRCLIHRQPRTHSNNSARQLCHLHALRILHGHICQLCCQAALPFQAADGYAAVDILLRQLLSLRQHLLDITRHHCMYKEYIACCEQNN